MTNTPNEKGLRLIKLQGRLELLRQAADSLNVLYEEFPELNDDADISDIIPRSLDEWQYDIAHVQDKVKEDILALYKEEASAGESVDPENLVDHIMGGRS